MAYAFFRNNDSVTQFLGMVVRAVPVGQCLLAQADVDADAANLLGIRLSDVLPGASDTIGSFQVPGTRIRMDAAPRSGDPVYLSAAIAGVGTTTAPALKIPLGICYAAVNIGGVDYADVVPPVPGTT